MLEEQLRDVEVKSSTSLEEERKKQRDFMVSALELCTDVVYVYSAYVAWTCAYKRFDTRWQQ